MKIEIAIEKFKKIVKRSQEDFSGVGVVFYDSEKFCSKNHCHLRPKAKIPSVIRVNDNNFEDFLLKISANSHEFHDGFHMVNEKGELTHVAQYFVPPIVKEISPDQNYGVRMYSSACGSLIEGVVFIGVISSKKSIHFFKDGEKIIVN